MVSNAPSKAEQAFSHKDDIRLSGGLEDLAIFTVPETHVSDGSDFELEFPREPER